MFTTDMRFSEFIEKNLPLDIAVLHFKEKSYNISFKK